MTTSVAQRRSYWLKTLHQWHWMSAALSLCGLIMFAATGFTLNNAAWIEAGPTTITKTAELPRDVLAKLVLAVPKAKSAALPGSVEEWLNRQFDIRIARRPAEFSSDEVYLSLPEPGGDAWLSIDVATGQTEYERSMRGWVSYFNDLHKGRHAGVVWGWFIDIYAVACLVFALTGLFLLQMHAKNRRASWPLVSAGLVFPVVVMLLFIH